MSPIALFIYNRPHVTEQVFARVKEAKPEQLFLIADGPKAGSTEDEQRCEETRCIVESIDWECQVFKEFSDRNLGCKHRISSGVTWVFEQVDRAIILEDDCLPHPSFFEFCQDLLSRYQDDERVMAISGNNFQLGKRRTQDSYYFSRYPHCWGWATWKRAWKYYDVDMSLWPQARNGGWLKDILDSNRAVRYWDYKFQQTYSGHVDTWDYAWTLACWLQNGLSILPSTNLVSNIGFDAGGTHHVCSRSPFSNIPTSEILFPLKHPSIVVRDSQADQFTQSYQFGLLARSRRKIRSVLKI